VVAQHRSIGTPIRGPRGHIEYLRQALTIAREVGDRRGEATHLGNLGDCHADLGQTQTAIEHYQQALNIAREISHPYCEAMALINRGTIAVDQRPSTEAADYYQGAIQIGEQTGSAQVRS